MRKKADKENLDMVLGYIIENEKSHFIECYNDGGYWHNHIYLKALAVAENLKRIDVLPSKFTVRVGGGNDPEFVGACECSYVLELVIEGRPVSGTDGSAEGVELLEAFLDNPYPQTEFFKVLNIESIE